MISTGYLNDFQQYAAADKMNTFIISQLGI